MKNERLRDSMHSKGFTASRLAEEMGVDPKTVERWITQGRVPYPKYRHAICARLREKETYLWPSLLTAARVAKVNESELVAFYSHRSVVPDDLWGRLFAQSASNIDILVYVGMFLTENTTLLADLTQKAEAGASIRLLFGDRDSPAVIQRSTDEKIGPHTISAKIDHALAHFTPLAAVPGVEIRRHGTVLYNSIYRFDDEMIVNPHVYGKIASHAPALHLRRLVAGDLFEMYADSFDAVWTEAKAYDA
jgi:hypothetical protein